MLFTPADFRTALLDAPQVLPLRHAVLRPGRPLETAIFDGDDDVSTRHVGLFARGELSGVASLYPRPLPANAPQVLVDLAAAKQTWQLRGMAVDSTLQRGGIGRELLQACVEIVHDEGGEVLWCNARAGVSGFYRASGFESYGDEFEIPDVGPHFLMARLIL